MSNQHVAKKKRGRHRMQTGRDELKRNMGTLLSVLLVISPEFIYTWQRAPLQFNLSTKVFPKPFLFYVLIPLLNEQKLHNCPDWSAKLSANLKAHSIFISFFCTLFISLFESRRIFFLELIWQVVWRHGRQFWINNCIFLLPRSWLSTSYLIISGCSVIEISHSFDSNILKKKRLSCTLAATPNVW